MYNKKEKAHISLAFDFTWSNSAHKSVYMHTDPPQINPLFASFILRIGTYISSSYTKEILIFQCCCIF